MLDASLWQAIGAWVDGRQEEMTEDLRGLVRIRSVSDAQSDVKPFGAGCREALARMLALGRRDGLHTLDMDGYGGCVRERAEACDIGLWGHLDVVPEGGGWLYPPYEGVIKDGYMIGRGSADNKAALVAALYALGCLRALGVERRHSAGVYFGCSEETGMADVPAMLERTQAPALNLVVDSGFPVCYGEAGAMNWRMAYEEPLTEDIVDFWAGEGPGMVPAIARITLRGRRALPEGEHIRIRAEEADTVVEAIGIAGHPAFPAGTRNALAVLAEYLLAQGALCPRDAAKFAFMRALASDNRGGALHLDDLPAKLYCTPTLARLENRAAVLTVNIRYPAGDPSVTDPTVLQEEMLLPGIRQAAAEQGVGLTLLRHTAPGLFLPREHAVVQTLDRVYHETVRDWGKPFILNGGCYAHVLPRAVGFGPGPLWDAPCDLPPGHGAAHGPDECQSLKGMATLAKVLAYALIQMDSVAL